jgi:hypothetical protein
MLLAPALCAGLVDGPTPAFAQPPAPAGAAQPAPAQPAAQIRRVTLDNGMRAVIVRLSGRTGVAVEVQYDVGLVDDPAGVAQMAHLAEHLRVMGGLRGAAGAEDEAPGAAFERLGGYQAMNAETLPQATRYELWSAGGDLEALLKLETARLDGLRFDERLIAVEAAKADDEMTNLLRAPSAPVHKFALTAAVQVLRGEASARVRGRAEKASPQQVRAFLDRHYRPERAIVAVVGDVDPDAAERLLRGTLGRAGANPPPGEAEEHAAPGAAPGAPPAVQSAPALDWAKLAGVHRAEWDAPMGCVVLAFPLAERAREAGEGRADGAPGALAEPLACAFASAIVQQRVMADAALQGRFRMVLGSGVVWWPGRVPVVLVAPMQRGTDEAEAARLLPERVAELVKGPITPMERMMITGMVRELQSTPESMAAMIDQQLRARPRPPGGPDEGRLVLGTLAIQSALRERLLGAQPGETMDAAQPLVLDEWPALAERLFRPASTVAVVLTRASTPANPPAPAPARPEPR